MALEHVGARVRITPARWLVAETADIPEMNDFHVDQYRSNVRPSSDISDSTYRRSKQEHITLFINYDYISHSVSYHQLASTGSMHLQ